MSTLEILTGPVIAVLAMVGLVVLSPPEDRLWVACYCLCVSAVGAFIFGYAVAMGWIA